MKLSNNKNKDELVKEIEVVLSLIVFEVIGLQRDKQKAFIEVISKRPRAK